MGTRAGVAGPWFPRPPGGGPRCRPASSCRTVVTGCGLEGVAFVAGRTAGNETCGATVNSGEAVSRALEGGLGAGGGTDLPAGARLGGRAFLSLAPTAGEGAGCATLSFAFCGGEAGGAPAGLPGGLNGGVGLPTAVPSSRGEAGGRFTWRSAAATAGALPEDKPCPGAPLRNDQAAPGRGPGREAETGFGVIPIRAADRALPAPDGGCPALASIAHIQHASNKHSAVRSCHAPLIVVLLPLVGR